MIMGMMVAIGPMTIDMYLPSLPALQAHFGVDAGAAQLTLSAYFLGLAIGQIGYGPVADRFGRRAPLLFGLCLYTLASLLCALAPDILSLSLLRFIQAIGGCAGMIVTRAMLRDRFEQQEMARILSAMVLVMGVAPILAPLAGGQILVWFGWQAIFLALAVFGVLSCVAAYTGLPETLTQRGRPIVAREVMHNYARLLAHRRFMGYALSGGIASAGMFAYISGSAFVFIEVFHITPQRFGLFFGANAFGLIVVSQLNSRLLLRFRAERVLRAALMCFAGSGVVLVATAATGFGGLWGVALPLFVCISSLGCSFPNATAAAMAPFGDRAGLASALMGTLQFSVAAIAGAAVGQLHDGTAMPMAVVIAACGLTALILLRVLVGSPSVAP
ncbi:Bcr/CflA family multidrug efflux MFS transporter [Sinimarinibacterium sp. CAU 1509]|uniref:Bcr/CflA family multidrug efflux MFS transporter n=1 Tax=Sinimarinibacterium sp. CAU 1509 TaxID=2562283 RepID=UPI0010ABBD6F|nr:Bcr/CflA family multidrug efflux MFS transporter [Sinimarinibacterium sp. CAU 1509]TJY59549.1 Bcr/CflA family multidrug efflux MFS transporter [Sinimarinibacterium sp. CAU 1509]